MPNQLRDLILAGDPLAVVEQSAAAGLMPFYTCWNPDPATIDLPALGYLLDHGDELAAGGIESATERLRQTRHAEFAGSCLALAVVEGGRDHVYRHYGTAVAQVSGRDYTGVRLSTMAAQAPSARLYVVSYDAIRANPAPLYSENANSQGLATQTWRRLVYPTTGSDGAVDGYLIANVPIRGLSGWPTVVPKSTAGTLFPKRYAEAHDRFAALSAIELNKQIETAARGLLGVGQVGVAILSARLEAFRFVGRHLGAMLGLDAVAMTRRAPRDMLTDPKALEPVIATFAAGAEHCEIEAEIKRDDGSRMFARLSFGRMDYNMGPAVALWMSDLTEHRRLQDELREARNLAERENRGRQRLMASLAHDIRTPVNAVLGFADALKTLPNIDVKRAREYGGLITVAGDMLSKLIGDLLDLSRLEAGKYRLVKRDIDPSEPLSAAVDIARPLAAARSIEISTDLPKGLTIVADPDALARIAVNLLSNAIKFTAPQGKVTLTLGAAKAGGVDIAFVDNGRGISPEALARIANPFEQADADEDRKLGTGLGLSIVQGLVDLHGGGFSIVSAVGKGTTVKVSLP